MRINKKITIFTGLLAVTALGIAASLPQEKEAHKFVNLKVLPKNIPESVLDKTMGMWSASLGVRCNFCHAFNNDTHRMDFASDAKPEKTMARHMFLMTAKINKKFFKAEKDSLGMVMESSVNCNTCHHGTAHPDTKMAERPHGPGPGMPPPGMPPPPAPSKG
ncbi:MAG: c-type cytochrome [Mucilaginibacter sp.]